MDSRLANLKADIPSNVGESSSAPSETSFGFQELDPIIEEALTQSYLDQANRLKAVLSVFGITKDTFSKSAVHDSTALANLATSLEISDTSLSSYHTAMTTLLLEEKALDDEVGRYTEHLKNLEAQHLELQGNNRRVEKFLQRWKAGESAESQQHLEHKHNAVVLQQKGLEYEERLELLENAIPPSSSKYQYSSLLELQNEVASLADTVKCQGDRLKTFRDLPPDLTLSKLKIAERRTELNDLIERKQDILNSIAAEIGG
ncbi:hypothetical protein DFS34DRAFT_653387 [Phlyctochytrium arcticum]|nr:hypothetical protein DFS34DRAFT_653387 [Phlyctochytrium arcticum]